MALPKQVQRQMEETAQLEAQLYGQQAPSDPQVPAEPATPATEVPPQPAAETPNPAPVPAAPAPEVAAPVVDPSEVETLKQRYAVLQGKYEAEVPRVHQANRELREQMSQLARELESLKAAKPEDTPQKPQKLGSDKDVEEFGADMIDMVRRHATDIFTHLLDTQLRGMAERLEGRVVALEKVINGVAGRQQLTEEQRFYADLTSSVPNWQAINAEAGWLTWLNEEDALTGMKRQALLDDATSKMDIRRVIGFFKAYEATKPATAPAPQTSAKAELASQVAPSRASANTVPSTPEKKFWNDAAVNEFYADVRRGKFVGREAEMQRIENDIHAAAAEGRYLRG